MRQIKIPTPWDTDIFNMPTWELMVYSKEALRHAVGNTGHYTIKVDPLADKRLLHEFGFYYCDTLIEPCCERNQLAVFKDPNTTVTKVIDSLEVMEICHGAFTHGRFHRDFNLEKAYSDLRYDNWLKQLLQAQQVYGLYWQDDLAGFIAYDSNRLVLHALKKEYRKKKLSKYWWSLVCLELLDNGYSQVRSSISAANIAVVKLYASLNFSFKNPQDVYHCIVP